MEGFRIGLKTFLGLAMPNQWLCLTNAPKMSESKYQAGFGAKSLYTPTMTTSCQQHVNLFSLIQHTQYYNYIIT